MSQLSWANRKLTLTQRAMLTLLGNMLVQAAEFLTGFFISPYIIRGLGKEMYGALGMIKQSLNYYSMTDLRGPTTLRFLLSLKQHEDDKDSKNRLIGATLVLWGICLPIAILLGIGLVYFAPVIIRTSPDNQTPVRIALAVFLVNSIIDRVLSLPMQVLTSQNMDFLGMGINTLTVLGGSLLSALAIWLGYGLPGLAVATMINVLLLSIGRFVVALKALPWLSIKLPDRSEFLKFFKTSAWLLFVGFGALLVFNSDTLLVGFVLGPSFAAIYVTSGLVMSMIGEPMYQVISSGNPGLMGLIGKQDWERVSLVRKEMYFLLLFFMTILGTGIIALNGPFLSLWVGTQFYGGSLLTVGIVLTMVVLFMSRIDLLITDAMLFLREKTIYFFGTGLVVILTATIFLKLWGINGIVVSTFFGNLIILFLAWSLIRKKMGELGTKLFKSLVRPTVIMLLLFGSAYVFGSSIQIDSWLFFVIYAVGVGIVALIIGWFLILSESIRTNLMSRVIKNIPFLNRN